MDKETTLREIDQLFSGASDLAIALIKDEARKILKADPNLHEFIMAMGGCFFTRKEGGKYDINQMTDDEWDEWVEIDYSHDFQKEFFKMVDGLNEDFKVMGYPVRFTATSKEVHHWGDTRKDPVVYEEMV